MSNSECEIIIVDDCSIDGTKQLLAETIEGKLARVIYQPKNQGKGAALREGFAAATRDIVIVQDADFEYDPSDYPLMIDPIVNDHLGDVYWAVGRYREAEFQWKRALSFITDDTDLNEVNPDRIRLKLEIGLDAVLEQEGGEPIKP